MTKCILNMIVKNESANLRRNLKSVAKLVNAVYILDTGSTDDTVQVIQKIVDEDLAGIPCEVGLSEFIDFGKTRTESYQKAQHWVSETLQWPLEDTYAIFLDADAEVIDFQDSSKGELEQPTIQNSTVEAFHKLLEKKPKGLHHTHALPFTQQHRLGVVRMDGAWVCKNACHEYWEGPSDEAILLTPQKVLEKNSGGNKPTKLERELKLLQKDIDSGNRTSRNLFQYGRALDSVKRTDEAIQILEECIQKSDWPEERYECRLILGRIWALRDADDQKIAKQIAENPDAEESKLLKTQQPGAHEKSMRVYWQAHEDAPWRGEALFQVAFQHRIRKEYRNACNVLRIALENVELPRHATDNDLFRDRPNVEWTAFVSSLFLLPGSWVVGASKRKTNLFQNQDIAQDKLLEELSISAFNVPDAEWRLRGHRCAEFLQLHGRTAKTRETAQQILQAQLTPTPPQAQSV